MTPAPPSTAFTVFIDGECPLCRTEARLLRRLDRGRGRLILLDITSPGFDASAHGTSLTELMGSIHGRTSDGRLVSGLEVFRRAYAAVGWGFLLAPTAWPGIRGVADRAYRWFARNRLRVTGRQQQDACGGRCALPAARAARQVGG